MSHVRHPIEAESFRIIESLHDWSVYSKAEKEVLQRIVHSTGDPEVVHGLTISDGAIEGAVNAFKNHAAIVTDVTMVQHGFNRKNRERIQYETYCGVHDPESYALAETEGVTRSSAAIMQAQKKFGDNVIVAVGNAPTALIETVRLIEKGWRPHLVIGLPVGFVNTRECKDAIRGQHDVPYITNEGFRGGSTWTVAAMNALMTVYLEGYYEQ
jgi:precorrin-8X/cobalt-precorrin-8 methylmutase